MTGARYQTRLKDLAQSERPQERLERFGPGALSDTELLAMLLRKGSAQLDVIGLATRLLHDAGSLAELARFTAEEFCRYPGIGKVRALQLITLMEVVRRASHVKPELEPVLDEPAKVADYMRSKTKDLEVEKFWVLCLNAKNRLVRMHEVTSGTATASLVHPREVFRAAIRHGATGVICVHNHPSGDPAPSAADLRVTRQLREASKTVDIDLLDHLIVGRDSHDPSGVGHYSFLEAGLL